MYLQGEEHVISDLLINTKHFWKFGNLLGQEFQYHCKDQSGNSSSCSPDCFRLTFLSIRMIWSPIVLRDPAHPNCRLLFPLAFLQMISDNGNKKKLFDNYLDCLALRTMFLKHTFKILSAFPTPNKIGIANKSVYCAGWRCWPSTSNWWILIQRNISGIKT